YADKPGRRFSSFYGLTGYLAHDWVSGKKHIQLDSLMKICYSLNIDLTEFIIAKSNVGSRYERGIEQASC
ncbi:MAG TPA: hypothetical protein VE713_12040, partial [Pyrinomonadaceae bacterium]|nr:hypothetical protein [Pyrinomonadaceae bacterium]